MLLTGLVLCLTAVAEPSVDKAAPKTGAAVPELSLLNLDGKIISLENYQGHKPVVLFFFASWSKSCQAELTDLQGLYAARRPSLEVIGVSFDKKSKDLQTFLAKNEISYPILLDKKLTSLDKFQILIIPTTFCLNKDGVIEKIFVDYDENVKKAVADWLTRT